MNPLALAVLVALVAVTSDRQLPPDRCLRPDVRVRTWAVARSPRLPDLHLRVPPGFIRDPGEDAYPDPQPTGSRWADSVNAQLVVRWVKTDGDHLLLGPLPTSAGRPEYSKCVERIDSANAEIVSYNRVDQVGEGYAGPYQIHARLRWPHGTTVEVYGMTSDRRRYLEMLATVRTIRRIKS